MTTEHYKTKEHYKANARYFQILHKNLYTLRSNKLHKDRIYAKSNKNGYLRCLKWNTK